MLDLLLELSQRDDLVAHRVRIPHRSGLAGRWRLKKEVNIGRSVNISLNLTNTCPHTLILFTMVQVRYGGHITYNLWLLCGADSDWLPRGHYLAVLSIQLLKTCVILVRLFVLKNLDLGMNFLEGLCPSSQGNAYFSV